MQQAISASAATQAMTATSPCPAAPPAASIALVTGATAGFGQAISRALLQAGWRVIGTGRRADRLEALRAQWPEAFWPLAFDVADRAAAQGALASLPAAWQDVDLLVNNAGLALGLERADQASLDDWDRMIDTNIRGLVTLTRLLLPQMVRRNRGYVINIGSIAGDWPYPGGNVYGATKAFVKQFSQNLRADLAGTAIRVSNVEPGLCGGTEFSNVRFKGDDERATSVYAGVQAISPEDIARIVLWLVQQPPHVNVNRIEVMPVAQSFAPLSVARG